MWPRRIAEIANNHQGSVELGKRIVDAFPMFDAIKLQYRDLSILHPEIETKHHERFKQTYLDEARRLALVGHARAMGKTVVVTPFDELSVEMCVRQDIPILKIASCSADDWPLLERIAAAGKPVIASTGGLGWEGIDNLYSFLKHHGVQFALMHCVGLYPTPVDRLNLGVIGEMRRRYDVPIGYSGHEQHPMAGALALAAGAEILERHVGLENLNDYSMSPAQAEHWAELCDTARASLGTEIDGGENLDDLKRGAYEIGGEIRYCIPRGGLSAGDHYSRLDPETKLLRTVTHEYEAMFRKAGIPMNGERELSHHFGATHIRDVGAMLVTVFNGEKYAKKLIALLPSQGHPEHLHRNKDETFQVLAGDLTIEPWGAELRPGDTFHIPPGQKHSFESAGGCIFEEISTHAGRGDSYYSHPDIQALDPIRRKTAIDE